MKKLYALFIAIDKYANPSHNLAGCENDLIATQRYLDRYTRAQKWVFLPKILINEAATRARVIQGFDHFNAAKDGDICFFFYSGHGSQAMAPPEFWTTSNGLNESIVCYDSRIKSGRDLMDKELGYLIWKATKNKVIHFLAWMDCCHSGTGTRSMLHTRNRNIAPNYRPLAIQDYIGHQHYQQRGNKINPPTSNHILLAACRDNETAKEQRFDGESRGIFTYSLLAILEKGGANQSYQELIQRTRIRMQQLVAQQHPQLEGSFNDLTFLGDEKVKKIPYLIHFNREEEAWMVDIGGMQGLHLKEEYEVPKMQLDDGKEIEVTEVLANYSYVSGMDGMNKRKQYEAWMVGSLDAPFSLYISEELDGTLKNAIKKELDRRLKTRWGETESDAQYAIKFIGENIILTRAGDDVPVFKRTVLNDQIGSDSWLKEMTTFSNRIGTVAYWEHILMIENPNTAILSKDIQIKVTVYNHPQKYKSHHPKKEYINPTNPIVLSHEKVNNKRGKEKWSGQVYLIEITNHNQDTDYFINGVFLTSDFSVNHPLNFNTNVRLAAGKTHLLQYEYKGKVNHLVQATFPEPYLSWGINEISEYIKIFVSTEEMNRVFPKAAALPLDIKGSEEGKLRPLPPEEFLMEDWTTFDIEFKINHPFTEIELSEEGVNELPQILSITCPSGFSGKASLTNLKEVTRNLNYPLPPYFWQTKSSGLTPITRGMNQSDGLEVLEIYDCQNPDVIDAENPMMLYFKGENTKEEIMIPWGIDAETGLFYPLGISDEKGTVFIQNLPEETPTQRTRSLGGSVKIFFQKLLKTTYVHPLLREVSVISTAELFYLEKDLSEIKRTIESGDQPKRIGVFIHGIIGDTQEMTKLVERVNLPDGSSLNDYYDIVLTFDYENLSTSIKQTARDFKALLEKVGLGENHGHQLHIFAHSMGGLVSRWMIEKLGGDQMITHLFQFGTPNGGSEWSNIQELAVILLAYAINGAAFLQPYLIPLSIAGHYAKKNPIDFKGNESEVGISKRIE